MIREVQGGMQLDVRHVAADAIAIAPLIRVEGLAIVAGVALRVVEGGIVVAGIPVSYMAGSASEFSAGKAAALGETQRLKT